MDYGFPEEIAIHFEGCYRLGRVWGMIPIKIYDSEKRMVQGARVFRDLILGNKNSRTFKSRKKLASVLKQVGFVMSEDYGEEIIPKLNEKRVNYSDGNSKFGHLEFLTDTMSNGRRNDKERTRKVYRIIDHPQELYEFNPFLSTRERITS